MPAELTIVVPTYNEQDNVLDLYLSIERVMAGCSWEVIFVDDDSPDGTASVIRELARKDDRVRCIQRLRRRGLASACIEGMLAGSAPYIAVMDADGQHDENLLPVFLQVLKQKNLDLVIGSRYIPGGSTGDLPERRVRMSRLATWFSNRALRHSVMDPMSGYFLLRRSLLEKIMYRLSGKGFKILLDILSSAPERILFEEIPYVMKQRRYGQSKLDSFVIWDYFSLLADRLLGRILPLRFISFVTVGLSGVIVHMLSLWCLHIFVSWRFLPAQALATLIAMTSNFILNNSLTYRDRPLRGAGWIRGLVSFYLACSIGAIINVSIADVLFLNSLPWWLCGMIGAGAGAVWNFAATSVITWGNIFTGDRKA